MPSATDIIWDLKLRLYCIKENQDLCAHDLHNSGVKSRIQQYMDSQRFPSQGSFEEYGFYFEQSFGENYLAQQEYLGQLLSPDNISLNIGHRTLAALLGSGHARVVFTTNFDAVIETAYSQVVSESLIPFHLEGAYAALDALNSESFPIYAKLHGDFRYRSVKNLPRDLLDNESEIQRCFIAAANRYGLLVTGYSGRDKSVMNMLATALDQSNPFPKGLLWTVVQASDVADSVCEFIVKAQEAGVNAHLVEAGTFDTMLSRIWRLIPDRPGEHESKVQTAIACPVQVPLPVPGRQYPVLRTNALSILDAPDRCGHVNYSGSMTPREMSKRIQRIRPDGIFVYTNKILFWGDGSSARSLLEDNKVEEISEHEWDNPAECIDNQPRVQSFFERAIVQALCWQKPLDIQQRKRTHYAIVEIEAQGNEYLQPLVNALSFRNQRASLAGPVPGLKGVSWSEALSLKLEARNGLLWLLIRPDIWISPQTMREYATDFLRKKKLYRYNNQSYALMDAWISVILGSVGKGDKYEVCCYPDSDYPAKFSVCTRTGYSMRGGANG